MNLRLFLLALTLAASLTAAAAPVPEDYLSCRCCCGAGKERAENICLYRRRGDSMADIIAKDREWQKSAEAKSCSSCVVPKRYRYCDDGDNPPFPQDK